MLKKVVFLDRDGTINRDSPGYIKSREEFEFLPGSLEAIRALTLNGFTMIVITNQSALPRQLISLGELKHIHSMLLQGARSNGGEITDIFYCPHMPEDVCDCRKPEPGLILNARHKYSIDLADAVMVGDSYRDIGCGINAGCGKTVLVKTGIHTNTAERLAEKGIAPDYVAEDLLDASQWIINTYS
ncbi:MAG: D-glycero-beta-D-manno-heptose 1,7-bisphosphate 7-phosphatase [Deltaproteobacteria bacterium]|nr:D-glycero-beta-D-manno-heptose 1,7-bisphosphate 7-phosphatase [Deltaproteobacteria bacterium]